MEDKTPEQQAEDYAFQVPYANLRFDDEPFTPYQLDLQKVSEQEKEIEDAKYWANEQAKGLNAVTDRNFELQTELTKANHSILSLTNEVSEQSQRIQQLEGLLKRVLEESRTHSTIRIDTTKEIRTALNL